MAICLRFNRWPFAGGPETATLAQMMMYNEAVQQLKSGNPKNKPPVIKRLTREQREQMVTQRGNQ